MKTILLTLLLTSLAVAAQTPPAPPVPALPPAPPAAPVTAPAAPSPDAVIAPAPGAPAAATEETIPPGFINWVAADLNQVLQIYADLVGRSILRPANLTAPQIVFKNQTELTKTETIQAIDAVLALNSIAMINVGEKFVKAVPIAQANTEGAPFSELEADDLPEMGQYVTRVVQLKYIKPSELQPVLQQLAKMPNAILPVETSQMLVLRDYTENIKRMLEMIAKLDVMVESEFISEVIPIKYARVEDIAQALNSLGGGGGGTTVGARSGTGGGITTPGYGPGGSRMGQPGGYTPGSTMTPGGLGSQTGTPSSTASFSDRIRNIVSRVSQATGSGDIQIIGQTKVVADARSNSLLIFATRQDMAMIKDIISKLDVVLAQVIIETVIMEVSLSDGYNFGVSGLERPHSVGTYFTGVGGLNNVGFLSPGNFASGISNGAAALGKGFSYFGRFGQDLDVTLTAAAADSRVTVIQKPRIQTSHATPASVFIGNTVPYVTGTYYGGYVGGPSSSYQQLRVGIQLNVTPFINQDGLVVMQVEEAIDEISGSTQIENIGAVPNTSSRTLMAELAVHDGETVILGGFIRRSSTSDKSGVPIIKDIPLLGRLFSSTSNNKERKELIVLMRPTVLRTPEIAARAAKEAQEQLPGIGKFEAEDRIAEAKRTKRTESRAPAPAKPSAEPPAPKPSRPETTDVQFFQPKTTESVPPPVEESQTTTIKATQPATVKPEAKSTKSPKAQYDDFNKVRPFTPEEEQTYGTSPSSNP